MIDGLDDISDEEKELMKAELPEEREYICPDIKSFTVKGDLVADDATKFGFTLSRKAPITGDDFQTSVIT